MITFATPNRRSALIVAAIALIATALAWSWGAEEARADHECSISIAPSFSAPEGSGTTVSATAGGCSFPTVSWDLDDDGDYDDATGTSVSFSTVGRDGPSSQDINVIIEGSYEDCYYDPDIGRPVCYQEYDSDEAQSVVNITNVAPQASFTVPEEVDEGEYVQLLFGIPVDPSSADVSAGFYFSYNCVGVWGMWTPLTPASCPLADGPSTMNVAGRVRDKDNSITSYNREVAVNNVAPTAERLKAPKFVRAGKTFTIELLGADDPSPSDELSYMFNCGVSYGAPQASATAECTAPADKADSYVEARVSDDDGAFNDYLADVIVDADRPKGGVKINGGDRNTTTRDVKLNLWAKDPQPGSGVSKMRFSKNGKDWTKWQEFASKRSFRLSKGDGKKVVYAQFRDKVGFKSEKVKDTITLK